jgi:hypothetical protein
MQKIGFIDYFLDEWHANNYPRFIAEFTVTHAYALAEQPDFREVKHWFACRGRQFDRNDVPVWMNTDQWCAEHNVQRAASIEEVCDKCDCLIVFSPDNVELKEALCQVPLRSGKPVFVDKSFAPNKEVAERIFELADKYGTPMFSSSSLRFSKELPDVPRDNIEYIGSRGCGDHHDYIIHQLEPLYAVMDAYPTHLMVQNSLRSHVVSFRYADGRLATVDMVAGACPFGVMVRYMDDSMHIVNEFSGFFDNFVPAMLEFFRTGKPPVAAADTIAIASAYGASKQGISQPGVWLEL